MDSQLLEGDIMDEGQEEWLSEGVLTDDDYNASQQTNADQSGSNLESQDETMASASADDSQMETQQTDAEQQIIIQQFDTSLTDNQQILLQQDDNDNQDDKHFVIDGQHIVFQGLHNQHFIIQQPDGSQQIVLQQFDNEDANGDHQIVFHQLDDQQDGQQLVFQQFEQTDGDQQIDNQQLVLQQFENQQTDADQQIDNQQDISQHLNVQQDDRQQTDHHDNQQFMQQMESQDENNKNDSNIEETLNNFEKAQDNSQIEEAAQDLPDELSTFLTRKTKPETADTQEDKSKDGDDDGNDTDDLLRVLGDGDQKDKDRVKDKHGGDSSDDDDSYIFEAKKKNYEATKNVIRRANASKAVPDDDLTECSSDEETKIVFTRVTKKTSPNRLSSTPQILTNVKPGTLTITPPNVQKKIVKKVIDVLHVPQTIRNVGKTPITNTSKTSELNTSTKIINTTVSIEPKTNKILNTSVGSTSTTSPIKVPYTSISTMSKISPTKILNTSVSSAAKTRVTKILNKSFSNMSASKINNTTIPTKSTTKLLNTNVITKTSPIKILNKSVSNMPPRKILNTNPNTSANKILNTSASSVPKIVSNVPKTRPSVGNVTKTSGNLLNTTVDSIVRQTVSQAVKRSAVIETEQKPPAKQYTNKRLSTQGASELKDNPTKMVVVKKQGNPPTVKTEQDFSNVNDDVDMNEKSSDVKQLEQLMMRPEAMDEEMPSDMDSEDEDDAMYDELPSSGSEEQSDWFTYDIRAERAGEYIPLLGERAYELLLEEKQRVTEKLTTLKKSLKVLTDASRDQTEKIQEATRTAAELDAMIKAT